MVQNWDMIFSPSSFYYKYIIKKKRQKYQMAILSQKKYNDKLDYIRNENGLHKCVKYCL